MPNRGLLAGAVLLDLSINVLDGLGFFKGVVVTALHWAGFSLPVALSATLLFRLLSFWAPMLPGILVVRSVLGLRGDIYFSGGHG